MIGTDGFEDPFSNDQRNDKEFILGYIQGGNVGNGKLVLCYCGEKLKDDVEVVMKCCDNGYDPEMLRFASERIRNDKNFYLGAIRVRYNGQSISNASATLRDDREVVEAAVRINGNELKFASERLRDEKEIVLLAMRRNSWPFPFCSERLKGDKTVVLKAVESGYYHSLQHASEELRDDYDVVKKSVEVSPYTIKFAGEKMRNNREIATIFFRNYLPSWRNESIEEMLKYLGSKLANDFDFILSLVNLNCMDIIKFFPNYIRNRKYAIESVRRSGALLEHFSNFKNDREVVLNAVKQNGYALKFVGPSLRFDKEVVFEAVKQEGDALFYAPTQFKKDKKYVLEAVKNYGYALKIYPLHLSGENDRDLILAAVRRHGMVLESIPKFARDREIVLEAVRQNGLALRFACKAFRHDRDFVLEAVKSCGMCLCYCRQSLHPSVYEDREIAIEAVKQNGRVLSFVREKFKKDEEIVLISIRQRAANIFLADESIKNEKKMVIEALKGYIGFSDWRYFSGDIKNDREVLKQAVQTSLSSIVLGMEERSDYELMLLACSGDDPRRGFVLADHFKEDKEFVKEVVRRNPRNYDFILEKFKNDEEIVLEKLKCERLQKIDVMRISLDEKERIEFFVSGTCCCCFDEERKELFPFCANLQGVLLVHSFKSLFLL